MRCRRGNMAMPFDIDTLSSQFPGRLSQGLSCRPIARWENCRIRSLQGLLARHLACLRPGLWALLKNREA